MDACPSVEGSKESYTIKALDIRKLIAKDHYARNINMVSVIDII
jgi:hypothetical protein